MAPWASFLAMLRASGMLGQRWHHIADIGLMLSTFRGILWFVLAFVGQELGPYWAYLGPFWAMLGHVGTILGSCWAILGYFRICVGLCFGLGHFNVVEFSSMQRVCKKCHKYQRKKGCVADGFCCYLFVVFVSFFYGMLHLGYACLINFGVFCGLPLLGKSWDHIGLILHHFGLCWAIVGYVGTILGSC